MVPCLTHIYIWETGCWGIQPSPPARHRQSCTPVLLPLSQRTHTGICRRLASHSALLELSLPGPFVSTKGGRRAGIVCHRSWSMGEVKSYRCGSYRWTWICSRLQDGLQWACSAWGHENFWRETASDPNHQRDLKINIQTSATPRAPPANLDDPCKWNLYLSLLTSFPHLFLKAFKNEKWTGWMLTLEMQRRSHLPLPISL